MGYSAGMSKMDRFSLYEASVQEPEIHLHHFYQFFRDIRGSRTKPTVLREDFCSTYWIAATWVMSDPKNVALGLDLDPVPLRWGQINRYRKLKPDQRERLHLLHQDVRSVTSPKADLIVACNFSFNIFHARKDMLSYFEHACESLKKDQGIFILEAAGGPGMIKDMKESRAVRIQGQKVRYTWHQKQYDPIQNRGQYAIHFRLPDGKELKDAFTYDWRMWTIPELKEMMIEAGFSKVVVYWEQSHKGEGTGEYMQAEVGENDYSWIAYVVGIK